MGNEQEAIVNLTQKAIDQVSFIFKTDQGAEGKGLRLGVDGGGCSGLSYVIDFSVKKETDFIFSYGEFDLYIDPKSSVYLKGVTLDFQDGLKGKGFVFNNPNAKNTCGCGESFSV